MIRLNDNLEQQAAAIFRSWFVNCIPFGGIAPDEWKNVTLEDLSLIHIYNPDEKEIWYSIFLYTLYIVLFVLFSRKISPFLRDFFCLPHASFFVWRRGGGWAFWLSPGNGLFMKNPGKMCIRDSGKTPLAVGGEDKFRR